MGGATEGRSPVHQGRNANKSISMPVESQKPAQPVMDRLTRVPLGSFAQGS
jgi:hypothetical protein